MLSHNAQEIWLVRFPFTDLTATKLRPALVLAKYRQDVIILGIFSKIPVGTLAETWTLIEETHPEFAQTGLRKASLIKAEKIATVHESVFQQHLGRLPLDLIKRSQTSLKKALMLL